MGRGYVSFPAWVEALSGDRALSPEERDQFRQRIIGYLAYLKRAQVRATVETVLAYLKDLDVAGRDTEPARRALRWFFHAAQARGLYEPDDRAAGASTGGVAGRGGPTPGAAIVPPTSGAPADPPPAPIPDRCDLGDAPWERRLVERVRLQQKLWRTEQTYRAWCRRFSVWLEPRSMESATDQDVQAFLSHLVLTGDVAAATQRQALNALVFFIREVQGREPGDFGGYQPARRGRRVPVVLTRDECRRLFTVLAEPHRLMAELAYGAGLRVMELLRLRVQDLDFGRKLLVVRGGKGDKDRVAPLPERLESRLRSHLAELRTLFDQDRAAGLAGVWLPPPVEHKRPTAGVEWGWQWVFPSRQTATDPRSGVQRRHHVLDGALQAALRDAARRADIPKRVTPQGPLGSAL